MKKQTTISLKFGIFTGIFLIIYFLIIGSLDLITSPLYSLVNVVICAAGVFLSISELSRNQGSTTYKESFRTGLLTGVYGAVIFTIFFAIVARNKSKGMAEELIASINFLDMNYYLLLLSVLVFGLITAYVVTFVLMKLFKGSLNLKSDNP